MPKHKYLQECYEKAMLFMHVCVNDQTEFIVFLCAQTIFMHLHLFIPEV